MGAAPQPNQATQCALGQSCWSPFFFHSLLAHSVARRLCARVRGGGSRRPAAPPRRKRLHDDDDDAESRNTHSPGAR